MNALDFQKHAEKMFPVVPHMGLSVKTLNEQESILLGSLAANKNHMGTAFGGSLYCFSALACYGLVWSALAKAQLMTQDIVISEGNIQYKAPVRDNFEVRCAATPELQTFIKFLRSKKKARVVLSAQVMSQGEICAHFTGTYVALL